MSRIIAYLESLHVAYHCLPHLVITRKPNNMALEDFAGFDQQGGMDAGAFERFQEKMRKAAAQIKAIQKQEKKQKKKEQDLVEILLKFIRKSHKQNLVLLISRVLEKNIPANFILAVALLGNEDIQKEIGNYLLPRSAPTGESKEGQDPILTGTAPTDSLPTGDAVSHQPKTHTQIELDQDQSEASPEENALIFFREDETLPLKVKIEIDNWIKGLVFQASEAPQKLLSTAYDVEVSKNEDGEKEYTKLLGENLVKLIANIIFEFLKQNGIEEDFKKLMEFSTFLTKGILQKAKEDLGERHELGMGDSQG